MTRRAGTRGGHESFTAGTGGRSFWSGCFQSEQQPVHIQPSIREGRTNIEEVNQERNQSCSRPNKAGTNRWFRRWEQPVSRWCSPVFFGGGGRSSLETVVKQTTNEQPHKNVGSSRSGTDCERREIPPGCFTTGFQPSLREFRPVHYHGVV